MYAQRVPRLPFRATICREFSGTRRSPFPQKRAGSRPDITFVICGKTERKSEQQTIQHPGHLSGQHFSVVSLVVRVVYSVGRFRFRSAFRTPNVLSNVPATFQRRPKKKEGKEV